MKPVLCGPPFSNGLFHLGHCTNLICKDFYNRYCLTFGLYDTLDYKIIFDSQGLPIVHIIEPTLKDLDLRTSKSKELVNRCIQYTNYYQEENMKLVKALELLHQEEYLTTKNLDYKVALMNYLVELYAQKHLKRSLIHREYCSKCDTTLANAEVQKEKVRAFAYIFKAKVLYEPNKPWYLLFATTEPSTIVYNLGLALAPNTTYHLVEKEDSYYIVHDPKLLKNSTLVKPINSNELENFSYTIEAPGKDITGTILLSNEVKVDSSVEPILAQVGCLHLSGFSSKKDLKILEDSKTYDPTTVYLKSKDQEPRKLAFYLKEPLTTEVYKCWKCKELVQTKLAEEYVLSLNLQERAALTKLLDSINLNNPNYRLPLKEFFSKDHDWCITRNKPYGTPFPFGTCLECNNVVPIYYKSEYFNSPEECYFPYLQEVLDRIHYKSSCCNSSIRVLNLSLDVWLDSSYLPLYFNEKYQTFIEGRDQIRGWFYGTSFLYFLKHKDLPFKGLTFLGWILNHEDNQKLSKSKKNYVDLSVVLEQTRLVNLRSYAISKSSSRDKPFSFQIIEMETKYINVLENLAKLVKTTPTITYDELLDLITKDPSKDFFMDWVTKIEALKQRLHYEVANLRFNLYWDKYKMFMLNEFSRTLVNKIKKEPSSIAYLFIRHFLQDLIRFANPVLGPSFETKLNLIFG